MGIVGWLMGLSVCAAVAFGISEVGHAAIDDARAATAADAAALAGAADGADAAAEAARRNGGTLVSVTRSGNITSVVVRVGEARGVAHAERAVVFDPA